MTFNPIGILETRPFVYFPAGLLNWAAWLIFGGIAAFLSYRYWTVFREQQSGSNLARLLIWLSIPVSLLLTFQVSGTSRILPNLPYSLPELTVPLLGAVPLIVGAYHFRFREYFPLILVSAGTRMLWETHDPYSIWLIVFLGLLFFVTLHRPLLTKVNVISRSPLALSAVLALASVIGQMTLSIFRVPGTFSQRIAFALTENWLNYLVLPLTILIAGIIAGIVNKRDTAVSSVPYSEPSEHPLVRVRKRNQFLRIALPVFIAAALLVGAWMLSLNQAKKSLQMELKNISLAADADYSSSVTIGKNLIGSLSSSYNIDSPEEMFRDQLKKDMLTYPFFDLLAIVSTDGNILASYPEDLTKTNEAVRLALQSNNLEVPIRMVLDGSEIFFVSSVGANPTKQWLIGSVEPLSGLYSTFKLVMNESSASALNYKLFEIDQLEIGGVQGDQLRKVTDLAGGKAYEFVHPIPDQPVGLRFTFPSTYVWSRALTQNWPLLAAIVLLLVLYVALNQRFLRKRKSVENVVKTETGEYKELNFDPLDNESFTEMQSNLKSRLDEMQKILKISQGISTNLEIKASMQPILEAALGDYALSARAVLVPHVQAATTEKPFFSLSNGMFAEQFAHLDEQIFQLMMARDVLEIPSTKNNRQVAVVGSLPHPKSILAAAVRQREIYFGAIWVAYGEEKQFLPAEVNFLRTLAAESVVAAGNASLISSSEIARRRLEAVLSSSPEPVLVFDELRRIQYANRAALDIQGLLLPTSDGKSRIPSRNLLALLQKEPGQTETQNELTLDNGKSFQVISAPVTGGDRTVGQVVLLRDNSAYKALEDQRTEFITTVSHELRSPLTQLKSYTAMLPMVGELNDQQRSYLERISSGVEEVSNLVNNLFDLSRLESGTNLKLETVDLADLVESVIGKHQPHASQKRISLEFSMPEDKPAAIIGDRAMLQQALVNLIDNGIRYTSVGGKVTIRLTTRIEDAVIEVEDSGIGIAPIDLPHIFERNFKPTQVQGESRGGGFGLSIVHSIVDRHHGSVSADSQLGKGTMIRIILPKKQAK